MKVTAESLPDRQVALSIEVEPETLERFMEDTYRRLVRRTNVPGFRRGRAPRRMLERYLGRSVLLDEALEHLVPEVCRQAIAEQGIEAFAQPAIELVQKEPVVVKATIPLAPTATLGDYRSLRIPAEPAQVTEEMIAEVMERMRSIRTEWLPAERPAASGDRLTIDLIATVDGQREIDQQGWDYYIVIGSDFPLPGFPQALMGSQKGDEKTFALPIPENPDWGPLEGKEMTFTVTIHEVKEPHLPPLDDAFAQSLTPPRESLEALRETVMTELQEHTARETRARLESAVVEEVVAQAIVEFPPILVEQDLEQMRQDQIRMLTSRGLDWERYLANQGKTDAQFREELRPLAVQRVRRELVLDEAARAENIIATAEEMAAEIERALADMSTPEAQLDQMRQLLSSEAMRSHFEHLIVRRKVMDRLIELTTVQAAEEEGAAAEAAAPAADTAASKEGENENAT